MYFIESKNITNRRFEKRKIRIEKIQKMWKQPKGNKYIELYEGLCRYAIKYGNNINYKTEKFRNDFYRDNKEALQEMRICEIIEGLKMLNFIDLINIDDDSIKIIDYKTVLQIKEMIRRKQQIAGR
ncbi:MAG: hypothetical protein DBY41_00405 [Clostridium sp.]|nr:MAG: hypothetical protein DBY41_00405 [Clostridium sp.]